MISIFNRAQLPPLFDPAAGILCVKLWTRQGSNTL